MIYFFVIIHLGQKQVLQSLPGRRANIKRKESLTMEQYGY